MNRFARCAVVTLALAVALVAGCDSDGDSSGDVSEDSNAGAGQASQTDQAQKSDDEPSSEDQNQEGEKDRPTASAAGSGTLPETPPPDIESVASAELISEAVGNVTFEPTELPGRDPSSDYNARRFKKSGGSGYGVGIQLWDYDNAERAENQLDKLRKQYIGVKELSRDLKTTYGSNAVMAERGGIRNFLFSLDRTSRVVAVSCSVDVCDSREALLQLVKKVRDRAENSAPSDGESAANESGGGSDQGDGTNDDSKGGSQEGQPSGNE